ncbi:hypothetical protein PCANB_002810 [Pneumocystis canis]|nr:hypothetical protein PCK1_002822 [Pneumocystis canis]KAG5438322.1 hypothetical protein PCANB_002810 [Pneumocystis canis]
MSTTGSMRFGPEWMRQGPHNNVSEEGVTSPGIHQNKQQNSKNQSENLSYSSILSLSSQPNNSPESSSTSLRYSKEFLLSIWRDMLMSEGGIPKPLELSQFSQVSSDEIIFPVSLSEMNEDEKKLFTGPVNSEQKRRTGDLANNTIHGNTHSYTGRVYSPRSERFSNNSRLDSQKTRGKDVSGNFRNLRLQKPRDYFTNTFNTELWTSPTLQINSEIPENNTLSNENNKIVSSPSEVRHLEPNNTYAKENGSKSLIKGGTESSVSQINTSFLSSGTIHSSMEGVGPIPGRNVSRLQALGMFDSQNPMKISPISATSSSSFHYDDSDDVLKEAMVHISEIKDTELSDNFQNKLNINLDINRSLENIHKEKTQFLGLFSPSSSPSTNQDNKIEKLFEHSIPQQSSFPLPFLLQHQPSKMTVIHNKSNWLYKDPMGVTQGPFSSLKMQDWYKAGFFQPTLLVKQVNDEDFEPLSSLIKRVGNHKEPFLALFPNKMQSISSVKNLCGSIDGWNSSGLETKLDSKTPGSSSLDNVDSITSMTSRWNHQSPFPQSFSYGFNLTTDQQNVSEHRKQEKQYLVHHKKDLLQPQQLTQPSIQRQRFQSFQKQTQNQQHERSTHINFSKHRGTFPAKLTRNTTPESVVRNKVWNEENLPRIDKEYPQFMSHFTRTIQGKLSNTDPTPLISTEQRDLLNFSENPSEVVFLKPETNHIANTNNIQKQFTPKKDETYSEIPNANQISKQFLMKQQTESEKSQTHSVPPWTNVLDDMKHISLQEIPKPDARNSQNRTQGISSNEEYSKKVNSTKKETYVTSNPSENTTWEIADNTQENSSGSLQNHNLSCAWQSSGVSVSKKPLIEIQHEEEQAQNEKANKYQKKLTINTMAASLSAKNYINSLKKPPQSPWITVGPDGRSVLRSTPTTSSRTNNEISLLKTGNPDNQKKSNILKFHNILPTNQSSSLTNFNISGNTTKNNSNEFINWCKMSLKALNPGVNLDDFLQMLMSLPVKPSQETIEIISDSIYANSAILDGRRFAEEFVRRRLENSSLDNGILEEKNTSIQSWTDALKSQKQKELEWNPVFKIVSNKKKQREKSEHKNT